MGNEAKKTFVQLLKYGVIGVSNTLITLVVFYVINTLMEPHLGVPYRRQRLARGGTVRSRIYHLLCSADGREPMVVVHIVA